MAKTKKQDNAKKLKKLSDAFHSMKSWEEQSDFLEAIVDEMLKNEKKSK